MAEFITLSTVHLPHPDGSTEFTGRYDDDGNPILTKKLLIAQPFETVEIEDQAIIDYLLECRAICAPEDYQPPVTIDENRWPKSAEGHPIERAREVYPPAARRAGE